MKSVSDTFSNKKIFDFEFQIWRFWNFEKQIKDSFFDGKIASVNIWGPYLEKASVFCTFEKMLPIATTFRTYGRTIHGHSTLFSVLISRKR